MGRVNVLDISVANLIAAGEVVERPASAIKEMVENSIDAGASAVTVEISHGGVAFMRVTDNGSGMSGEDAVASLRRHATSKIKNAEDLSSIMTLGFRGEALAAITAVTAFRLMTKQACDQTGTLVAGEYGAVTEVAETGCPDGTTVILERLFATTPARLKFLKSDAAEGTAVMQALERLAVSHPEIAFRFIADGNLKFATMGDGNLKNAVYAVYGGAFATKLLPVSGTWGGIGIEGFICAPDAPRGNRTMEHFFINGRCVRSKSLSAALEAAYRSYIPSDKFPTCILNLNITPNAVDVNIHPSKLEVKFSNEKTVFDALYGAVRATLSTLTARPELTFSGHGTLTEKVAPPPSAPKTTLDILFDKAAERGARTELSRFEAAKKTRSIDILDDDDDLVIDLPPRKKEGGERLFTRAEGNLDGFALRERLYAEDTKKAFGMPKTSGATEGEKGGLTGEKGEICEDLPVFSTEKADTHAQIEGASVGLTGEKDTCEGEPILPLEKADTHAQIEGENRGLTGEKCDTCEGEPIFPTAKVNTDAKIEGAVARDIPEYRIVGELFNCYVILEVGEKMILFDKHAAHERINYERLRANMKSGAKMTRLLLASIPLDLSAAEKKTAEDYEKELAAVGFEVRTENGETALVGIPDGMKSSEAKALFATLLAEILENGELSSLERQGRFERSLYQSACKMSVKGGRVYDMAHIKWIADNLLRYDCIRFCPHGRPVAFEISKSELESRFGRT